MTNINQNQDHKEQLSAMLDGELDKKQTRRCLEKAVSDSAQKERWYRYNLIGAVLKKEQSAYTSFEFTQSIAAQIDQEMPIVATTDSEQKGFQRTNVVRMFRRVGGGLALAASVAYAVVFSVQMSDTPDNFIDTQMADSQQPLQTQSPVFAISESEAREQERLDEIQAILDNMGQEGIGAYEQQVGGEWIVSTKVPVNSSAQRLEEIERQIRALSTPAESEKRQ